MRPSILARLGWALAVGLGLCGIILLGFVFSAGRTLGEIDACDSLPVPAPAVFAGRVYSVSDSTLVARNESGEEVWRVPLGSQAAVSVHASSLGPLVAVGEFGMFERSIDGFLLFDKQGNKVTQAKSMCPPTVVKDGVVSCKDSRHLFRVAGGAHNSVEYDLPKPAHAAVLAVIPSGASDLFWVATQTATRQEGDDLHSGIADSLLAFRGAGPPRFNTEIAHSWAVPLPDDKVALLKLMRRDGQCSAIADANSPSSCGRFDMSLVGLDERGRPGWETALATDVDPSEIDVAAVAKPIAIKGGALVVGTGDSVIAIGPDGIERWRAKPVDRWPRLTEDDRGVLQISGSTIALLDPATGAASWSFFSKVGEITDVVRVGEAHYLLVEHNGWSYVQAVEAGRLVWSYGPPASASRRECEWLDWQSIHELSQSSLLVSTASGEVFALDLMGGVLWRK